MKILALDLRAFGPFTNLTLDLSSGREGFHLIHGPNEAGKTSALRALRQALFGIDQQTNDDFVHPYGDLRIGITARHSDGSLLEFLRRKGKVGTVRAADDTVVIEESKLAHLLGGVDLETFKSMFGIDHHTLVAGGRQIVQGEGKIGSILFAAGSGLTHLKAVQTTLVDEMDLLFKASGRNQQIVTTLKELADARERVKTELLSREQWEEQYLTLETARAERVGIEERLEEARGAQRRLVRFRDAAKTIAWRAELTRELADLEQTVLLPAGSAQLRVQHQGAFATAVEQERHLRETMARRELELSRIQIPQQLLDESKRIGLLKENLGSHRKALADKTVNVARQQKLEHQVRGTLRKLGREPNVALAREMEPKVADTARLQELSARYERLVAAGEHARSDVVKLEEEIEKARRELEGIPASGDCGGLRNVLREVQQQGNIERTMAAAEEAVARSLVRLTGELPRLHPWSGTPEALVLVPVPAAESVDHFQAALAEVGTEQKSLQKEIRELDKQRRDVVRKLLALEGDGVIPSEAALREARSERDNAWARVRRVLDGREKATADLAGEFESKARQADQVADDLRLQAGKVTAKAGYLEEQQRLTEQLEGLQNDLATLVTRQEKLQLEWVSLWEPVGIEPRSPAEMQAWRREQVRLVELAQELDQRRRDLEGVRLQRETARRSLEASLAGHAAVPLEAGLTALLVLAETVMTDGDRRERQREQLGLSLATATEKLSLAKRAVEAVEADLAGWRADWQQLLARMKLGGELSPREAQAELTAITEMMQDFNEADVLSRRNTGIDREAAGFSKTVRDFCQQVVPELADLSVEESMDRLSQRLEAAQGDRARRDSLLQEQNQARELLEKIEQTRSLAAAAIELLCKEAGCQKVEELPALEQKSDRKRKLLEDNDRCHQQLLSLCMGQSVVEFVAAVSQVDADRLEGDIERYAQQIEGLERERSEADQKIGAARDKLADMKGDATAATTAEQVEALLARLQTQVRAYAVRRLAAAVLSDGVERYRERSQGPVVARASELFAQLTCGSFDRLKIDTGESGEPELVGVRRGAGRSVRVSEMSDGSGDQLYLSLRIASLEAYLAAHEPLPFIVDDILLNFDNERAGAALAALGDLSRRVQVLFFTHHEHLIDLARARLDGDTLFLHRLERRS